MNFPRFVGLSVLGMLSIIVTGCGGVSSGSITSSTNPSPTPAPVPPTPSGTAEHIFAFWYEPWDPQVTPNAIKPADIVIGIPPSNVPTAHSLGKMVMQYQTYYQSQPNSLLLTSTSDLANVGFEINHQFLLDIFGKPPGSSLDSYVLCPNSVVLHKRIQQYVQLAMASGYDGLFIDNTFFDPPAHNVCDGSHAHVDPSAQGGRAFLTLLAEVRQMIKSHNPNAILMTNPGNPEWGDHIATGSPTLWDLSDYVLCEGWGYTASAQHDNWVNAIPLGYSLATVHAGNIPQLVMQSYVKSVTEARFAFAAARFFGFKWTGNLGVKSFGTYLNSIPWGLGEPTEPLPPQGDILQRKFEHGAVFVNISATQQSITAPQGTLYLGEVTQSLAAPTVISLAPRMAAIVLF